MTIVDHISIQCTQEIPQNFFIFLLRYFLSNPKQRPQILEIKISIFTAFFSQNSQEIESLIYPSASIHGTKDNVID